MQTGAREARGRHLDTTRWFQQQLQAHGLFALGGRARHSFNWMPGDDLAQMKGDKPWKLFTT